MTPEAIIDMGRQALLMSLMLGAPLLLCTLVIGLIVGIFQAATQINEATLSFIPKLIGMAAVIALAGPWMLHTLMEYTRTLIENIPNVVH